MTLTERLGHLPRNKRRELERVARILFEEFEDAQRGKLSVKRKGGRILKLVLFGSHARGDRGEDRKSDDRSSFDLLVVVSTKTFADPRYWYRATERIQRELTVTRHLATPVNFIVHSIMDLNDQLAHGRPFFVDIARDGIMLYEAPGFPLVTPKPLDPEAVKAEARRQFEHWFPIAARRFALAKEAMARGYDNEAAFDLHQTVERLYHVVLQVLTRHSPKSHRLACLRTHAERAAPTLTAVWPRESRFARRYFARLDRAYVDARYSRDYEITGEELAWLVERVTLLQETAAAICAAHLDDLEGAGTSQTGLRHAVQDT
ncbi:HEPN domain-containing protein [Ciceribacter azotifigens]|uniref:HEPN domain-containing protein n=1 Tax=Ciceribacter azotifigens TaxID=2069303 RepID=UPI003A837407